MNNKIRMLGIALVIVLTVAAIGAGIVFAQTPAPSNGFRGMMGGYGQNGSGYGMMGGRGGMMGGSAQNGDYASMTAMHQWMNAGGGMHTFVWNALAEKLGLSSDELTAAVNSGKTLAQVAEEKGVSRADLVAVLETAHKDSLAQAVTDGALTQDQADTMLAQMAGRYDWMLDNLGSGYGMMNGRGGAGGMMGAQGGQAGAGGCGRNYNAVPANQQPKP